MVLPAVQMVSKFQDWLPLVATCKQYNLNIKKGRLELFVRVRHFWTIFEPVWALVINFQQKMKMKSCKSYLEKKRHLVVKGKDVFGKGIRRVLQSIFFAGLLQCLPLRSRVSLPPPLALSECHQSLSSATQDHSHCEQDIQHFQVPHKATGAPLVAHAKISVQDTLLGSTDSSAGSWVSGNDFLGIDESKLYQSILVIIPNWNILNQKFRGPPGPIFQLVALRVGFGPFGPAWLCPSRPSGAKAV